MREQLLQRDKPYFTNDRARAPMPAERCPPMLALPPTAREAAEGIVAMLVTSFARDHRLTPEERAIVADVQARVVLPITELTWVNAQTGAATPARLEPDQLRHRLLKCRVVGVYGA